ncbi:MAG: aminopeptidase P N-terminal domain-containing protein [Proteobacteria bacterium]|nr:aminopeptidase P N-terminal domain-containing protein [Pseudomonadota bacterium]
MTDNLTKLTDNIYLSRRKKLLKNIKSEAAIFISNPETVMTRDQHHPYHHASDIFYLTGFSEPETALVLLGGNRGPRSILYLRDKDPVDERWNGDRLGIKSAKRRFQIDEVRDIKHFIKDLPELLATTRTLHYSPGINLKYDQAIWNLFSTSVGPRLNFPTTLKDARLLTSELRFIKDKFEIDTISHAVDITIKGIGKIIREIPNLKSEVFAAKLLEAYFVEHGASGSSFNTIVASGKNSTILHHNPKKSTIWNKDLLLIDAGALYCGYAGDITRTVPASGKFSQAQAAVYDIVHAALKNGIALAKPNSCLDDVHLATVRAITRGLVDLKILKGNVNDLIANGAYKKYYMHRSGHWLGIDVHDISPITVSTPNSNDIFMPANIRPFVPGNVFTIEPGIYIDARDQTVPAAYRGIGIRIEDDVLITNSGCKVLSDKLPTERNELEDFMSY